MKSSKTRPIFSRASLMVAAALLAVGAPKPAKAANLFWDANGSNAGLGGTGTWNTTTANWFNAGNATTASGTDPVSAIGSFTFNDVAYFLSSTGSSSVVTLGQAITIGGLNFSGFGTYEFAGTPALTLAAPTGAGLASAPVVSVGVGSRVTASLRLSGSQGLLKTGNGTLVLANSANDFTGDLLIRNGAVVVSNPAQLGASTSPVMVQGLSTTGGTGVPGGSLVLQGTGSGAGAAGLTMTRGVSLSGRGGSPTNDTGALVSIGYNTLANLTVGNSMTDTRVWATHGTTTITGSVLIGAGNTNYFYGNGNFIISGVVSGTDSADDRFNKNGRVIGTTLWLQNAGNNFNSAISVHSGTVRVNDNLALGRSVSSTAVDLNNGWLEVRTDNAGTSFAGRNVRVRNNTSGIIFVDHGTTGPLGLGSGQLQNQTLTFGSITRNGGANNVNYVFAGRNGFGQSYTNALPGAGDYRSLTLQNNSSGLVSILGSVWNANGSGTNIGTFTVTGGGDTLIAGAIFAANGRHSFTKGNSGTLTFTQDAAASPSTFLNNANINDGTVEIRTINVLNPNNTNAGRVVFGGGALSFLGATGTGAGETWTNKILDLNIGSNQLRADQAGSAPTALVVSNNFASSRTDTRTLLLGGSAPAAVINQIAGAISGARNVSSVTKFGSATWELLAPAALGQTVTLNLNATGTTASPTVTLSSGSTAGLVVGQPVSGTGINPGSVIVQILDSTNLILSDNRAANTAAGTASAVLVSGITTALTTTAASTGTANPVITLASTAGLVPGQKVVSANLPSSQNWFIRDITSATTVTLANGSGATLTVGAVASGTTITPEAAPNFGGNLTVTNGLLRATATGSASDVLNTSTGLIFNVDTVTGMGNAGGTFAYVGWSGGSSTEVLGRLTPTAGHGVVSVLNGTGADTLTFQDLGTRGVGATLDYQPGIGTINFNGTAPAGTNGIQSGYATFNGVDWVNSGATASQFTAYTDGAGALTLAGTTNFRVGAAASTAADGTINSLKLTGGAALTLGGQLSFSTNPGGVLFDNSAGTATIGGGTLGTAAQELVVITNGTAAAVFPAPGAALTTGNALTIDSLISSGAGLLTKSGNGTLILTGANAYTGDTTINLGAVQMSGANAVLGSLATAGNITRLRQGGLLDVNAAGPSTPLYVGGPSFPLIATGSLAGTGVITNSGGGTAAQATVSLGGALSTGQNTFGGLLQDGAGRLNVVINGAAGRSQAILGAQPYTGVTVINTGVLAITRLADGGVASGLGASSNAAANLIFNAGTLSYTGAGAAGANTGGGIFQATQTPSVSTDRLFSLAGNATILSNGTYGNEALGAGTGNNNASIIFSNTGDLAFVTSGAKTLTLGGTSAGDNIFRPRVTDNGLDATALTVSGGLWILNPAVANTYTGVTTISGGQLRAVDGVGIPANSLLTLSGGVLEVGGTTFTRTLGTGAGQVQLTAGNTGFAAGTTNRLVVTLSGGAALTWGSGGFSPGQLVLGSGTALGETEFTNAINVGTSARTITVNNNGNTGTMMTAGIVSGVISGGAGGNLVKEGGGVLILGNANTYVGTTTINNGNLIVTSIGGAGSASSLGAGTGALIYNPGDGDLNGLFYVGPGETATRSLTLQSSATLTASRTFRIDSSGSGPLIWNPGTFAHTTRSSDTNARTLTLELRGSNVDGNQLNAVLTNSTGAATANILAVNKADGGTWILNPASPNTFTGAITASGGMLGLTANSLGTGASLSFNNGSIFGYGGPLTISRPVVINNNTTGVVAGPNSITISGTLAKGGGANNVNFDNFLEPGAVLTVSGTFTSNEAGTTAAAHTLVLRGTGNSVWSGIIGENAAAGGKIRLEVAVHPNASVTLSGGSTNTYTDDTVLTQGTLILSKQLGATKRLQLNGGRIEATVAQTFAGTDAAGGVIFNGNPVTFGGSQSFTFNGTTVNWDNNRWIFNELTGGAVLNFGAFNISNNTNPRIFVTGGAGTTNFTGAVVNGSTATTGQIFHRGTGHLNFTAANTITVLLMERGTATIGGAAGSFNSLSSSAGSGLVIRAGGALTVDNGTSSLATRLGDTSAFSLEGGTFNYVAALGGTNETTGIARFYGNARIAQTGGPSTLTFTHTSSGVPALDFALFTDPRGALDLTGTADLGVSRKVIFTGLPSGFQPKFLVGNGKFGAYDATNGIVEFTGYSAAANVGATAFSDVLRVDAAFGADDISVDRTLRGLAITDTSVRNVGATQAATLTVSSGGILAAGGVTHVLSVPRLNFVVVTPPSMSTLATVAMTGGVTTNGSANVTVASTTGLLPGMIVTGTGIPLGATVAGITNPTSFVLSVPATGPGTGLAINANSNIVTVGDTSRLAVGQVVSGTNIPGNSFITEIINGTSFRINNPTTVAGAGNPLTASAPAFFNVASGTSLDVQGALVSNSSLIKAGAGTLILSAKQFTAAQTTVLEGTLRLAAGDNTLFGGGGTTLNVERNGTLDLAGNSLYTASLRSLGSQAGGGGTITNSSTTTATFAFSSIGDTSFFGSVAGNVNFARLAGSSGVFLSSAQTHTGTSYFSGFRTVLRDEASLLNTSAINLTYGRLQVENGNSNVQLLNRISDTAPLTLRGGSLVLAGLVNTLYSERIGAVTLAEGDSDLQVTGSGSVFWRADLLAASLTRNPGATVNFSGTNRLGQPDIASRIIFDTALPNASRGLIGAWAIAQSEHYAAYSPGAGVGIIGDGGFAGYDPAFGAGNFTQLIASPNAAGSFGANQVTALPAGPSAAAVLRFAGNAHHQLTFAGNGDVLTLGLGGILRSNESRAVSVGTTAVRGGLTSSLSELIVYSNATGTQGFTGAATNALVLDTSTITLDAVAGTAGIYPGMTVTGTGIIGGAYVRSVDPATNTVVMSVPATATANAGTYTFGAANLIFNSVIQDVGVGSPLTYVKAGAGIQVLTAQNTYTGGTIVNSGDLHVSPTGTTTVVIPAGGITVNGGPGGNGFTSVFVNASGAVDGTNSLTLNGTARFNFAQNTVNTLSAVTLNASGGEFGSNRGLLNVGVNSILNLTGSTPFTAASSNPYLVSEVANGRIILTSGAKTFAIDGVKAPGSSSLITDVFPTLHISSILTGTSVSVTKTGNGLLQLSGANEFTGGLTVSAGGIIVSASSTPIQGGNGLLGGPLGTGAVTMAAGTRLLAGAGNFQVGNTIAFQGTPVFAALDAGTARTLTLNGTITGLPNGTPEINVASPWLTLALRGVIPNIANITAFNKTGLGASSSTRRVTSETSTPPPSATPPRSPCCMTVSATRPPKPSCCRVTSSSMPASCLTSWWIAPAGPCLTVRPPTRPSRRPLSRI
jgi:autotransporter-associated beta strand protein